MEYTVYRIIEYKYYLYMIFLPNKVILLTNKTQGHNWNFV